MKRLITLLTIIIFPLNVFAYSNKVYLGGNTIGVDIKTNGVMVIGFYKINGKYNNNILKQGDYITKVNNYSINNINDLTSAIEKSVNNNQVDITYKRNGIEYLTTLKLIYENNTYKTGLYVKDGITGIGTLTYVDPESNIYGALGHEIIESNSSKLVEIKTGYIYRNSIISIDKSTDGNPGAKNAKFYHEDVYGSITKNTTHGIYGKYYKDLNNELVPVAKKEEARLGEAKIYTVLKDEAVKEYTIDIKSINESTGTKNFTFEITDDELIDKTGGIIQGMSGSPIMQDGKLIGAVTHVIVDNPVMGYGIFITTMLEEGEK
jgi:stage IV sporulation protein B